MVYSVACILPMRVQIIKLVRVRKIELVKVQRVDKGGGVQKMFSQSFSEFRLGIL